MKIIHLTVPGNWEVCLVLVTNKSTLVQIIAGCFKQLHESCIDQNRNTLLHQQVTMSICIILSVVNILIDFDNFQSQHG